MSLLKKVSSAIRILHWNRDVSARASHLVVKKDALITYERAFSGQAGSENVSGSTVSFERKLMSTKTSIKRIAAVAAVALTLGGFSAVSAHADTTLADTLALSTNATSTTVGVATKTYVTSTFLAPDSGTHSDTLTVSAYLTSAPAYNAALPVFSVGTAGTLTDVNATSIVQANTAQIKVDNTATGPSYVAANNTLTFTPTLAGTYTILVKNSNATTNTQATALTWTITVAANPGPNAAFSKLWMQAGSGDSCGAGCFFAHAFTDYTSTSNAAALAAGDVTAAADVANVSNVNVATTAALAGTVVAQIAVFPRNNLPAYDTAASTPVTATISGPGYVAIGNRGLVSKSVTQAVATSGTDGYGPNDKTSSVWVYSDGTTGVATVTISAGGVTLGTRTVTFYGTAANAKATNNLNILSIGGGSGAGTGNGAAEIYVTDSTGNPVAGQSANIKGTSSDVTVLNSFAVGAGGCADDTVSGAGYYYCDVTTTAGQTATGKSATMTFYVMSGSTVKATSGAITFTTGDVRADKITLSTDADSYAPGDKVTVTISAVDASGNPVADYDAASVSTSIFAADVATGNLVTSSAVAQPLFKTALVKFAGGKATATFYAPFTSGNLVISGTLAGTLGGAKTAGLTANLVGTTITKTVAISSAIDAASQAAIDAAQEATDAANAAYDAANNAMDSADAATAAAQDASDNASAALAAVTELSATVAKLVASVNSIASALASIKKKLGVK
jgi:hypothetical protein